MERNLVKVTCCNAVDFLDEMVMTVRRRQNEVKFEHLDPLGVIIDFVAELIGDNYQGLLVKDGMIIGPKSLEMLRQSASVYNIDMVLVDDLKRIAGMIATDQQLDEETVKLFQRQLIKISMPFMDCFLLNGFDAYE